VTGLLLLASVAPASAQLKIDITSGVTDPLPIAVTPFVNDPRESSSVVMQDLERSGRFVSRSRTAADYLVTGTVRSAAEGGLVVEFELVNLLTGQRLLREQLTAPVSAWRNVAHRIADRVYLRILGVRSSFATRIAYVSVEGAPPEQRHRLIIADADGENSRVILESKQPLMSPVWSPDGEWLAYVSFESRAAAIFVQRVRTGERRRVSARAGVNGAPSWSPDGRRLVVTLSSPAGNLDVHLLDLETLAVTRLTEHPGIDTEAVFSPDGSWIYFTSDRAGGPQIYRMAPSPGARAERITFNGPYNARARLSADGLQLAHVTREGRDYRIAVQDLRNANVRVLSKGSQDESPAFSPDGGTLIFATRERARGVLATVSVDGLILQRLAADRGDVREPSWGPFLP
jgi:TolB protein